MTKLNPPTALVTRPAFGSTGGGGAAFGSPGGTCGGAPGGGGVVVAGAGDAAGVEGGGAAVVVPGGAGSGSAFEVAGNAMVTALALVTAAIASVAHNPLRRAELGSNSSMATNLPCYGCDARTHC